MSEPAAIKPTDKNITEYLSTLSTFVTHSATHEGATETAFSRLLAVTAQKFHWTLIPKQKLKVGSKLIYPDGTLQDRNYLRRGYWEAKDTNDDLDAEIIKKKAKGYPLGDIIFEDTERAVLFQDGKQVEQFDLRRPSHIADLLTQFYRYTEPDIEGFEQAVEEFKERVPDLAAGLQVKLEEAHKSNKRFGAAFQEFFQLCQTALNPNIRREAVDEMLIQHLLTERLFRKMNK